MEWVYRATSPKTMSGAMSHVHQLEQVNELDECALELPGDPAIDNQLLLNVLVK